MARNFWAWVAYQFFYRIGWQFKMEATLMAGIISFLNPSPYALGTLTALATLGKNAAPLLAAPIADRFRHKRYAVLLFWLLATGAWAALTVWLWLPAAENRSLSIWVFGALYGLFFICLGATNVAQGTLLGKIIPAVQRGRAMAVGMTLSGVINVAAILFIYQVIKGGAFPEPRNYALAFSLTTLFFLMAAASLLWVTESDSEVSTKLMGFRESLGHFARLAREHDNLARLMFVNVTAGVVVSVMPFYTSYWRHAGTITPQGLIMATVLQVTWQCVGSSILGRVADRKGNRGVIIPLVWADSLIPMSALVLGGLEPFRAHWQWYLGVYALIGARFPVYQLLINYQLEVVPQRDHAMALGAVNAAQLITVPMPLLFGAVATMWGYPAAFMLGTAIGLCGAVASLGLREVRVFNRAG